jgi:tetratricopeptide (TPR) repeat protein
MKHRLFGVLALCAAAQVVRGQLPNGSLAGPARANVRPDTNVFVVLPFTVSAPANLQYLGEGMVELLDMSLDGVGSMRIEAAPAARRRLSLEVANEGGARSPAEGIRGARAIALEVGAGRVITGTVTALGSEVRIRAQVYDPINNRPQFTVETRADLKNVEAAVDSLASRILARRLVPANERTRLLAGEYETRSPSALQAFLVARHQWLRGERRVAAESLKSAIHQDSTFGRAYLLLARVSGAEAIPGVPSQPAVVQAAIQHIAKYPERVRAELELAAANIRQERLSSLRLAEILARRYPNDPDIAFRLADAQFHYGLNLGEPLDKVIRIFRRALAFEDVDPEAVDHFRVILEWAGDTTGAREVQRQCVARYGLCSEPDFEERAYRGEELQRLLTGRDTAYLPLQAMHLLSKDDPTRALAVIDGMASIQTGATRESQIRGSAYLLRSNVALARGQYERAWAFLDSARALDRGFLPYRFLTHLVTGTHPEGLPSLPAQPGTDILLTQAWWAAVRQPPDSAENNLRKLETNRPWADSARAAATAVALRGILALRAGDTVRAIRLLTQARSNHKRNTAGNRMTMPGAWLGLKLAELEAARGDYAAARLNLADVFPATFYVPFIGDAEELRAKVALATGDTSAAKVALKKMIGVWENADAVLQPRVAAARATLAKLEGNRP